MEQKTSDSSNQETNEHSSDLETSVASTVSIVLDSQPSCCEFAKSNDILVVGTYNLIAGQEGEGEPTDKEVETPAQQRTGSLLVFHITGKSATLLHTKALPHALLDLHFSPTDPSIFAVATSVGTVCFFSIDYERSGALQALKTITVWDPSVLVLSLAYQAFDVAPQIAVSGSSGSIALFPDTPHGRDLIDCIPAHGQEAWTVAFSRKSSQQAGADESEFSLYSGGDDSTLMQHKPGRPQSRGQDRRSHLAGVTAIVVLPVLDDSGEEILVTGSYDDVIRVLIPPSSGSNFAAVLAEKPLGGGVWRISRQYIEEISQDTGDLTVNVLASCMNAGAKVVQIRRTAGEWTIEVIAEFTEHESMNYASDVRASDEGHLFVSTSFYDRKLCVWKLPH